MPQPPPKCATCRSSRPSKQGPLVQPWPNAGPALSQGWSRGACFPGWLGIWLWSRARECGRQWWLMRCTTGSRRPGSGVVFHTLGLLRGSGSTGILPPSTHAFPCSILLAGGRVRRRHLIGCGRGVSPWREWCDSQNLYKVKFSLQNNKSSSDTNEQPETPEQTSLDESQQRGRKIWYCNRENSHFLFKNETRLFQTVVSHHWTRSYGNIICRPQQPADFHDSEHRNNKR